MKTYTVKIHDDGNKVWYHNGVLHREDGPAIEGANGDKWWYLNSKFHREDGPAMEFANGSKSWWIYGKLHRTDGPAVEYTHGDKRWYFNGKEYTESEFNMLMGKKEVTSGVLKVVEIDGVKYELKRID